MRVVHVLGALLAGGAERFVVDLAEQLSAAGDSVELLILSPRRDVVGDASARRLEAAHIASRCGPTERVGVQSVLWYAREVRRSSADIIHLHNLNSEAAHFLVFPWFGIRAPVVRTVHNTELSARMLERASFALNPVDATVFCSTASLVQNAARFRGRKLAIPNGVRFDWLPRQRCDRTALRGSLGLRPGVTHFLAVGRMFGATPEKAQKAHDVLIEAWQLAKASRDGAELHLLGDGPLRPELERRAAGTPGIRFHGVRDDVTRWLCATDVFVMPSRWEGLPIAGLEAIGSGLHCVFSRIAPLEDLAAPSVSWCEPGDATSLANALDACAAAPPEPKLEAIERFRADYSVEACARKHRALYDELLRGRTK